MCHCTYQRTHSQKILGHYYKHLVGSSQLWRRFHLQQPLQFLVSRKIYIYLENSKYMSFRNDELEMVHRLGIDTKSMLCVDWDTFTPSPLPHTHTHCHRSVFNQKSQRGKTLMINYHGNLNNCVHVCISTGRPTLSTTLTTAKCVRQRHWEEHYKICKTTTVQRGSQTSFFL